MKCPEGDDHKWKSSIHSRTAGTGCPICSNQLIIFSNSLAAVAPEITKEWHPTKNKLITPDKIAPSASEKVWWKCSKGDDHEWKANPIVRRKNGSGHVPSVP